MKENQLLEWEKTPLLYTVKVVMRLSRRKRHKNRYKNRKKYGWDVPKVAEDNSYVTKEQVNAIAVIVFGGLSINASNMDTPNF